MNNAATGTTALQASELNPTKAVELAPGGDVTCLRMMLRLALSGE